MIKKGFTLIELVMVIVLLAIVSASSFVSIGAYKSVKLDAAAKKVAADISLARSLALAKAVWCGASFNAATEQYSVYQTDGNVDTVINNPAKPGTNLTINLNTEFSGVMIAAVAIPGGGSQLEFSPRGIPYNDKNGAALASEAVITLSFQAVTKNIHIAPTTGRVTLQ